MSFSIEVKEEIARNDFSLSETKALLSAFFKINGVIKMTSNSLLYEARTENAKTAKLLFISVKKIFNQEPRLLVFKKMKLKKNNVYIVQIRQNVEDVLFSLEIKKKYSIETIPSEAIISDENTKKAYLAGCFLASGSVNSPRSKNYHLEISSHTKKHSEFIKNTINSFNLNSKIIKRRNNFVVYLKKSEEISDFLKLVRVYNSLLKFEDERISKDYFNFNNRLNICEVFNDVRTIETANRQIQEINLISRKNKDYLLDQKDKKIIEIRLKNPESSLQEIADLYTAQTNKKISKSGVNHRFRKINQIAKEIKNKD